MAASVAPSGMQHVDPHDEERDEFRHRMRVNCLAAAAVITLLAFGIWLADAFVEAHKVQGCYASGFHSCSLI
jgi:hypothetical protein